MMVFTSAASDIAEPSNGPIGIIQLLRASGMNKVSVYFYVLYSYSQFLLPLFSLIGGIGILKIKTWARKLIMVTFSANIVLTILNMPAIINTPFLKRMMFSKTIGIITYVMLLIFEIITVYYLSHPKVKEQFKQSHPKSPK